MDKVLSGYTEEFCHVYMDDILKYSNDWQEHLSQVLERLRIHGVIC